MILEYIVSKVSSFRNFGGHDNFLCSQVKLRNQVKHVPEEKNLVEIILQVQVFEGILALP